MKRSTFLEKQGIAIQREQEAGVAMAEVCRKHGISTAPFYAGKAKYGGLDVSQAHKKALEEDRAGG
jgi:putative transposase